ncbi:MAG: tail fiber protein [Anaerocolumna sp.]
MEDQMVGQIQLFAFGYAPRGWLSCIGMLVDINQYPDLFSVIGNKFGGDGVTCYAVPNLKGARPLNVEPYYMSYYIAAEGYNSASQ